ncbi:hypothetical protein GJ744_005598 [Endocarpon pusillum]|uniref:Uncharacterized protein n=1 Tax=Endocarpon pusillum TaxID=364733 RepID=A0A8H7AN49_9EURO|nr:hypothetical protein GJ744_005598 [Endocarpon pusillum]
MLRYELFFPGSGGKRLEDWLSVDIDGLECSSAVRTQSNPSKQLLQAAAREQECWQHRRKRTRNQERLCNAINFEQRDFFLDVI